MKIMGKFVIKATKTGFTFSLKAVNGEIVAVGGEVYNTIDACKNGCESVRTNAPIANLEDQTIEGGNNSKYARSAMGIPDNGTLSVKGSGDVIIWPNDLSVNFMEITVTSGNTPLLKWTANSATPTTGSNRWHLSPGCKWVKYGNAYYLEGMGYIYINAGTTGDVTVTIKAYGDGSTTSKITVNDVTRTIVNGAANATTYNWTVPAANRAPMRDGNGLDNNATNN